MIVSLNCSIINGPWGGGNRFAKSLHDYLIGQGHTVVFDLSRSDVDIILVLDPRRSNPARTYGLNDVLGHIRKVNPGAIVVHRINECDERKNTKSVNLRLRWFNRHVDCTVFVGSWLMNLDVWDRRSSNYLATILNGYDSKIFNREGWKPWNKKSKLKLVTHHWGGNLMKGFDVYGKIDDMLDDENWGSRFSFTYVGNVPSGFKFRNVNVISPLFDRQLADELKQHHAYITASINEPGGNHQNEAFGCGLPVMYRNSGCLPEYCDGFGIQFEPETFDNRLKELIERYDFYVARAAEYPRTAERTNAEYLELFFKLIQNRVNTVAARNGKFNQIIEIVVGAIL